MGNSRANKLIADIKKTFEIVHEDSDITNEIRSISPDQITWAFESETIETLKIVLESLEQLGEYEWCIPVKDLIRKRIENNDMTNAVNQ